MNTGDDQGYVNPFGLGERPGSAVGMTDSEHKQFDAHMAHLFPQTREQPTTTTVVKDSDGRETGRIEFALAGRRA